MWFSARLLFECEVTGTDNYEPLQEEKIKLIQAATHNEAQLKADAIGHGEQHEYANCYGETVRWRFLKVLEVQEILADELSDGVEVYWRFLPKDEE